MNLLPPPSTTITILTRLLNLGASTPRTSRAVRKLFKEPLGPARDALIKRTILRAVDDKEIAEHKVRDRERALAAEKSRKTRSKPLGLTGDPHTGQA